MTVARAQGSWRSRSTGRPSWSWRRTHSLIWGGALLLCGGDAGAVTVRVDAPPCSAGKLEVCFQDGGATPRPGSTPRTPAPAQTCPPGTKLGPFGCTPVSTPAPAHTPRPAPTCPPGTVPSDVFGCVEVVGPPTRTPVPSPTQASLRAGGPFQDGAWFCPDSERCADWYAMTTIYAVNASVANAVWRKTGKPLAPREVWNGFISTNTGGTAAQTWAQLGPALEERLREYDAAILSGRVPPPVPELVTAEQTTMGFLSRGYWQGGFYRANGTEKPVEKWPEALTADERWLIGKWRGAGGGPVTIAPYVFTWVSTSKDTILDGETWLTRARRFDPLLFPDGLEWREHPRRPGSDYPSIQAWVVAKTALERWLRRLRIECPDCGVVVQLSNGAYPDLPGAEDAVWMDRAVRQLPAILKRAGLPPMVQFEAFDPGPPDPTGRSLRLDPAIDCRLLCRAQEAGALLSVFNAPLARTTQEKAWACACGGPR